MASCGGLLRFGWSTLKETGETRLRLREAHFCRIRHCPVCQWRRSLMWQAFLPVPAAYRGGLPQCPLDVPDPDRAQLCDRGAGRDAEPDEHGFPAAEGSKRVPTSSGWIRTTEVTRGSDGSAHPHFHTLMMVPPSMLSGRDYIKHGRWVELWRSACGSATIRMSMSGQ